MKRNFNMNQQQRKYFVERINGIKRKKVKEFKENLPDIGDEPDLSVKMKYDMIADGTAKLKPFSACREYYSSSRLDYMHNCYIFPELTREVKAWKRMSTKQQKEIENYENKMETKATEVVDKAMFSEEEAIIQAMKAFEAMK